MESLIKLACLKKAFGLGMGFPEVAGLDSHVKATRSRIHNGMGLGLPMINSEGGVKQNSD